MPARMNDKQIKFFDRMLYVCFGVTIVIAIVAAGVWVANRADASTSGYSYTCPEGQYPIGDGQCKQQPTGCAYGDSIPKDSEKCAPETAQDKSTTPAPAPAPAAPPKSSQCK